MADVGPPLVHLPDLAILAANIAAWAVAHVGGGFYAHRLPQDRLEADGPVLRLRSLEAGGRCYERHLGIRRWKDRLPEAGAFFPGGASKRHLSMVDSGREAGLEAFRRETRRAERAHWSSLLVLPLFWIWNPPVGVALMVLYGVAFNAPFVAVQRYNRARVGRVLDRRQARGRGAALGPVG